MWKRLVVLWAAMKRDLRVFWHALRHPASPRWLKLAALGMLGYLLLPTDLIPDMIPVLGFVDELVLLPLALRWLLRRLPPQVRADAERRAASGGRLDGVNRP